MAATLTRQDSFDHGILVASVAGPYDTITGSPTITTSTPRTGSRCLEMSPAGAAEGVRISLAGGGVRVATDVFYVRFVTSLPGADATLFYYINANGNGLLKYDTATGRFALAVGGSADSAFGPGSLSADTWYRVVIEFDTSTGTATIKATIDGGTEGSQTNSQTAADISSVNIGTPTTHTYTARYDDWAGSNTDGDYELFKATTEHQVESLIPSADGTHSISGANEMERTATGTDIINSTTDAYQLLDDEPMDSGFTDYVNDVGTNAASYVEVTFENLASGSLVPWDVKGLAFDRDSTGTGTSAARCWLLLSDNTEVAPDLRLTSDDPGTTVTMRKKMLTRPSGGWDRTKVDGLKARMGLGDGAPDVWFSSLMVEVALFPAGTTEGAAAQTLPALTQSAEGYQLHGAAAQSLPALTQSAAGATQTGVGAATLPALAQSATGELQYQAATAQTLPALTQAAAGTQQHGAAAQTLPALTQAAAGATQTGVGAATLPALTQSATGEAQYWGATAQTLPALSQAADANFGETITGAAAQTLPALAQASEGYQLHGAAAQTLPALSQSATGATQTGVGAATLPGLTQSAAADVRTYAAVVQTLPGLGQSAVAGSAGVADAAQTLPSITQSSQGHAQYETDVAQTLPALTQSAIGASAGTGATAQTLPALSQQAIAEQPDGTVRGNGFTVLPALAQVADGDSTVEASAAQTLPALGQSASGATQTAVGAATLPGLTQTATAEVRFEAVVASLLPALGQVSGGIAGDDVAAVVAQTLPALTQLSSGAFGLADEPLPVLLLAFYTQTILKDAMLKSTISKDAVQSESIEREGRAAFA